eukprot:SAG31_NODE_13352_length_874_cov_0.907216_1_plen_128_part_01
MGNSMLPVRRVSIGAGSGACSTSSSTALYRRMAVDGDKLRGTQLLGALAVLVAAGPRTAQALPPLKPCAAAKNRRASDRWGICAGESSPLSLRGSNYIRLGGSPVPSCHGYHTTFDAGVYNRTRYIAA